MLYKPFTDFKINLTYFIHKQIRDIKSISIHKINILACKLKTTKYNYFNNSILSYTLIRFLLATSLFLNRFEQSMYHFKMFTMQIKKLKYKKTPIKVYLDDLDVDMFRSKM